MKAISLWQPWASLWLAPNAKIHETRSWPTKHRGLLAVHASKKECQYLLDDAAAEARRIFGTHCIQTPGFLPLGAVIGVIQLQDCVSTTAGPATEADRLFGNWSEGRYAWRRGAHVQTFEPVPCRGYQGLWNLDPAIEAAVLQRLKAAA